MPPLLRYVVEKLNYDLTILVPAFLNNSYQLLSVNVTRINRKSFRVIGSPPATGCGSGLQNITLVPFEGLPRIASKVRHRLDRFVTGKVPFITNLFRNRTIKSRMGALLDVGSLERPARSRSPSHRNNPRGKPD